MEMVITISILYKFIFYFFLFIYYIFVHVNNSIYKKVGENMKTEDLSIRTKYHVEKYNNKNYIGAIKMVSKDIDKLDYAESTRIGAFVHILLIGLKYGVILNIYTLISLIITIIFGSINNFKEKNLKFIVEEDNTILFENTNKEVVYTENSINHLKCPVCGDTYAVNIDNMSYAYTCDLEKTMHADILRASKFFKYGTETCYIEICTCYNKIAYYMYDIDDDVRLPDDYVWDTKEYMEYRKSNYIYKNEDFHTDFEKDRLINHTFNTIMTDNINSLDFIRLDYPCTVIHERGGYEKRYDNLLHAWRDIAVKFNIKHDHNMMYNLLKSKFSRRKFKTMLIHANIDNASLGFGGIYDCHLISIQKQLIQYGYIKEWSEYLKLDDFIDINIRLNK